MKIKTTIIAGVFIFGGIAIQSCSSKKEVTRVDSASVIDLSGRWNDTDSKLVSEEMVSDMLFRPWLKEFEEGKGRRPVIIVGLVRNKSSEHIATETFIKDIEKSVLNSGKVRLVQAGEARESLRIEKADQIENSTKETAALWGEELGADFILQGVLSSIVDSNGDTKVTFYQTDLALTNIETSETVWIGDKKIKKVIQ